MTTDISYPATPELDKMLAVNEQSQVIGEFLEWFCERHGTAKTFGFALCKRFEDENSFRYIPQILGDQTINKLLARFFGIDYDAMQKEREAVYQYVRAMNEPKEEATT